MSVSSSSSSSLSSSQRSSIPSFVRDLSPSESTDSCLSSLCLPVLAMPKPAQAVAPLLAAAANSTAQDERVVVQLKDSLSNSSTSEKVSAKATNSLPLTLASRPSSADSVLSYPKSEDSLEAFFKEDTSLRSHREEEHRGEEQQLLPPVEMLGNYPFEPIYSSRPLLLTPEPSPSLAKFTNDADISSDSSDNETAATAPNRYPKNNVNHKPLLVVPKNPKDDDSSSSSSSTSTTSSSSEIPLRKLLKDTDAVSAPLPSEAYLKAIENMKRKAKEEIAKKLREKKVVLKATMHETGDKASAKCADKSVSPLTYPIGFLPNKCSKPTNNTIRKGARACVKTSTRSACHKTSDVFVDKCAENLANKVVDAAADFATDALNQNNKNV